MALCRTASDRLPVNAAKVKKSAADGAQRPLPTARRL